MRVRKEAAMLDKLIELAKEAESELAVNQDPEDEQEATEEQSFVDVEQQGGVSEEDMPLVDNNPIGLGTIPVAYTLLTIIFGEGKSKGIKVSNLKRVVVDRRFPDGHRFKSLESRPRFRPLQPHFLLPGHNFVKFGLGNIRHIICPFLSTLINEGALPLKQIYTEDELMQATIDTGLPEDNATDHVADNFANTPTKQQDLWNLEGATNEHKQSTGINDCKTTVSECRGTRGHRVCKTETRRTCFLPNKNNFDRFVRVVDANRDQYITEDELFKAADLAGVDSA